MAWSDDAPIRVFLVEASAVALALLKRGLAGHAHIRVVGSARDTGDALKRIPELDPQVLCVSPNLPILDGQSFIRSVMAHFPRPILLVGISSDGDESPNVFQLFDAGALDLYLRPMTWNQGGVDDLSRDLAARIESLAALEPFPRPTTGKPAPLPTMALAAVNMVVLAGGLGAIGTMREILSGLPTDFPAPILCVQHLDGGMQQQLVDWMAQHTAMPVHMGVHGEVPMAGSIYFPPEGKHLALDGLGRMVASNLDPVEGRRPAINVTLESVAVVHNGAAIAVLLSGQGRDGVRGMAALARVGAVTLVEDRSTAAAFDLPGRVRDLDVATHMLPGPDLLKALLNLTSRRSGRDRRVEPVQADPRPEGRAGNLLVVEDSPTQAFKLRRFLQESGYAVTVAKDGVEGLEAARRVRPQLIVSDVSMPRMDGFELCRAIKNDPELKGMPVMLVTALTNPGEILSGLAAGADNYLTKPWEGTHLLSCIQELLQGLAHPEELGEGLEIHFEGQTHIINSSRRQILDLLLNTYQKAVRQNKELTDNQLELKMLNMQLVEQASKESQLNKRLQEENRVRAEVEVRQARTLRELEEANRELDDFAFIVSHDLKAPFRAIGSLTSWLVSDYSDQLDAEGRDLVALLATRAQRINTLIEALLQYTRVSRVNERLVAVNLDRLVRSIIKTMEIPEEMEILVDPPLPTIHLEERPAQRIFFNLIDNAVRYMDKEAGTVRVGLAGEDEAWWRFEVVDTGPGIEERHFKKIFGVFQTLQPRDELETAGMGLALVRKIIGKYGGNIGVESTVGKGSTFHFTLPKDPAVVLEVHGRREAREGEGEGESRDGAMDPPVATDRVAMGNQDEKRGF